MFTVNGHINGKPCWVTWDEGELTVAPGNEYAKALIENTAKSYEGEYVGPVPVGCPTLTKHLEHPLSALCIIMEVLEPIESVTGDVPTAEPLGPGEIA